MTCRELAELLMQTPDMEAVIGDDAADNFYPVAEVVNTEVFYSPGYPQYMDDRNRPGNLSKQVMVISR